MSGGPVHELVSRHAFSPTRSFDALPDFHVPFERLVAGADIDRRIEKILDRGGSSAVVGRAGSGKSSLLAAVLQPPEEIGKWTYAPVRLAIGGERNAEVLSDPRELARRAIGDLAANYLTAEDAAALRGRGAVTVAIAGASEALRLQLGTRHANVSKEVRQAAESFNIERTSAEVLSALGTALQTLRDSTGFRPVLLLDDADGLLNLPGLSGDERAQLAEQFFALGLPPLLRDLDIAVLLAAQPNYERVASFKQLAQEMLEATITLPSPAEFTEDGLRLLVSKAMLVAGITQSLDAVFDEGAMRTLVSLRYSMDTVRQLIGVCRFAALEADNQRRDTITEGDIAYGASQTLRGD